MPKSVKYIGTTSRWPELAVTGKQSTWEPGKIEERSDTEAAQLLATGLFADQSALQLPDSKVAAISGVVSAAGNQPIYPLVDMTWVALVALAPADFTGRVVRVTDLNRNLFESNGTRWKPVNGRAVIGSIDTDATMTGNAETIMFQRLLPAGLVKNGDTLSLTYTIGKSGTAETTTVNIRLGAAGTVADASLSGFGPLTTTNISAGLLTEYTRVNATSLQKLGSGANNNAYGGPSTAALQSPVTVANMDTTALYLSLTMAQSAAVETATLRRLRLELISSGV